MDWTERYIKRLDDKGSNKTEALFNKTKFMVNNQFDTSPSFTVVKVNDVETDSIVNNMTKYNEKSVIFRPDTLINIGSVVDYKDKKYLLMSFIDDEIYPKGEIKLCNSTFPIQTDETSILLTDEEGNPVLDRFGDEIYIPSGGDLINVPCIVETSYSTKDNNVQLPLPDSNLKISIQYNNSSNIKLNYEFGMYGSKYKITHIDYSKIINEVGILIITAEMVVTNNGDV